MATEWISRDPVVAALDMCAVLEHYDIEAGRGSSFRIHCPFHDDERPSCSVNPGAKVFNCFSCGEQGNVLDFIAGLEDLDMKSEFPAVLEKAIEIIGHNPTPQKVTRKAAKSKANGKRSKATADVSKPSSDPNGDTQIVSAKKKKSAKPNKRSKKHRKSALEPDGSLALEPNEVLTGPAFPLKLKDRHPWLDAQLKRIGVSRKVVSQMAIGFEDRSQALMAGRVCFPIHNAEGSLVAYSGRWASDDVNEEGMFVDAKGREQPRYRLPKGFNKQLELFNWHRVCDEFADTEVVVLVEGFWSVVKLHAHTIPSVALMGLTLCDAQIRLLLEGGIRCAIVVMDGDDQGRAADEAITARLAPHLFVRSLRLPDGVKPDDIGEAALTQLKELCVAFGDQREHFAQTLVNKTSATETSEEFASQGQDETNPDHVEQSGSSTQPDPSGIGLATSLTMDWEGSNKF